MIIKNNLYTSENRRLISKSEISKIDKSFTNVKEELLENEDNYQVYDKNFYDNKHELIIGISTLGVSFIVGTIEFIKELGKLDKIRLHNYAILGAIS
ncbi:MAG: hypothetical protein N2169_05000 [bacterium]|nr:hypothetical protein [bacterium]